MRPRLFFLFHWNRCDSFSWVFIMVDEVGMATKGSIGMVDCIDYTCANMHVSNNDESMNWFIRIVLDTLSTGNVVRSLGMSAPTYVDPRRRGSLDKDRFPYQSNGLLTLPSSLPPLSCTLIEFLWAHQSPSLNIMQIHHSLFLVALASICVRAQNITASTAIATPSDLGDPTKLSSYPICAVSQPRSSFCHECACLIWILQQFCINETAAYATLIDYGCDIAEPACLCQPPFRARTAACKTTSMTEFEFNELIIAIGQKIICSLQDYLSISHLIQIICYQRIFYSSTDTYMSQRLRR